jgi:hypothetical protein
MRALYACLLLFSRNVAVEDLYDAVNLRNQYSGLQRFM